MARITVEKNLAFKVLPRCNVKSNIARQMEFPYCVIFIGKNPHQTSDIAAISTAKHQHSSKSLKIKFKSVKELEKATSHKDVASLFGETKNTLSTWKKKWKIFRSYENGLGAKSVKPERYEALNKALKKWLLILSSENVLVNGSLLKERALEFANELNIQGFQASEGWLKNERKNVFSLGSFQLIFTKTCKGFLLKRLYIFPLQISVIDKKLSFPSHHQRLRPFQAHGF